MRSRVCGANIKKKLLPQRKRFARRPETTTDYAYVNAGDTLIGISTTGNSVPVCNAVKIEKVKEAKIILEEIADEYTKYKEKEIRFHT